MHLSYTETDDEEFQGPTGDWFCDLRAITLDNWLIWRHALPEPALRPTIPLQVACNVTALAQRIHQAHQRFPNYKLLMDTPFHVSRWWDPGEDDPDWGAGRAMLCRVDGYAATEIARYAAKTTGLVTRVCSQNWIELRLLDDVEASSHSLLYDAEGPVAG